MRPFLTTVAGLVAATMLLFGCADDGQTVTAGTGDADEPVSGPPDDTSTDPAPADGAEEVDVEPGVAENVRARPFDRAEVRADDGTIQIFFTSGVRDCNVLDRVEVERPDPDTVEVTLYEGSRPGANVCIEIAVSVSTVVDVDDLGADTQVVDGTDGQVKS